VRTRLSICIRKSSYATEEQALTAARSGRVPLRTYRCERCGQFHLTSRTKGKRIPRPVITTWNKESAAARGTRRFHHTIDFNG
jgi:hypothetical protein